MKIHLRVPPNSRTQPTLWRELVLHTSFRTFIQAVKDFGLIHQNQYTRSSFSHHGSVPEVDLVYPKSLYRGHKGGADN